MSLFDISAFKHRANTIATIPFRRSCKMCCKLSLSGQIPFTPYVLALVESCDTSCTCLSWLSFVLEIASNDPKVLEAFLPEDHTKGLQNLDFDDSSDLTQRSLGLSWVKAIAAVAYLKVIDSEGKCHIGFVLGKAKLAPTTAHTVPRLELGAAVLAVELAELVKSELDISVDSLQFYTDSKVVLGLLDQIKFLVSCC